MQKVSELPKDVNFIFFAEAEFILVILDMQIIRRHAFGMIT